MEMSRLTKGISCISQLYLRAIIAVLFNSQFQVAMLFRDSALLDRMFRVFDKNDDENISFDEYIACLSVISNKASKEDKTRRMYVHFLFSSLTLCAVSFQIYDFDCDGLISVSDLTAVVAATLREHGVIISRADLDKLVAHTMAEAHPTSAGLITYEEYVITFSSRL